MSAIDTYLKSVEPSQQKELQRIREFIIKLVPEAEETLSYGMPTFKYKGKILLHIGAFKNHMSIFPTADPEIGSQLSRQLEEFRTSKGTLQFTEAHPIPDSLIKDIVAIRIQSILQS